MDSTVSGGMLDIPLTDTVVTAEPWDCNEAGCTWEGRRRLLAPSLIDSSLEDELIALVQFRERKRG